MMFSKASFVALLCLVASSGAQTTTSTAANGEILGASVKVLDLLAGITCADLTGLETIEAEFDLELTTTHGVDTNSIAQVSAICEDLSQEDAADFFGVETTGVQLILEAILDPAPSDLVPILDSLNTTLFSGTVSFVLADGNVTSSTQTFYYVFPEEASAARGATDPCAELRVIPSSTTSTTTTSTAEPDGSGSGSAANRGVGDTGKSSKKSKGKKRERRKKSKKSSENEFEARLQECEQQNKFVITTSFDNQFTNNFINLNTGIVGNPTVLNFGGSSSSGKSKGKSKSKSGKGKGKGKTGKLTLENVKTSSSSNGATAIVLLMGACLVAAGILYEQKKRTLKVYDPIPFINEPDTEDELERQEMLTERTPLVVSI